MPDDPHIPDDPRAALAEAQYRLLAALVAGAEAPEGFDAERLAVQSRALAAKRARHVTAEESCVRNRRLPWWSRERIRRYVRLHTRSMWTNSPGE